MNYEPAVKPPVLKPIAEWTVAILTVAVVLITSVIAAYSAFKSVGRAQHRADAKNAITISNIEIRNQEQRILVAKQKAEIRRQEAIGVREAQDEIAKTLTPLYVQFEMVDALRRIAESGRNNTVVYIPAGANGIPLVSTIDSTKVGEPDARAR